MWKWSRTGAPCCSLHGCMAARLHGCTAPLHADVFSSACSLVDMASSVRVKDSCQSNKTDLEQALWVSMAPF